MGASEVLPLQKKRGGGGGLAILKGGGKHKSFVVVLTFIVTPYSRMAQKLSPFKTG